MTPPATVRADLFVDLLDRGAPVVGIATDGRLRLNGSIRGVVVGTGPLDVAWADYQPGKIPGTISRARTTTGIDPGMEDADVRADLALDLSHHLGRAQLARVLAAGLLCPDSRARLPPSPPSPNGCRKCNGTGYLRRPSDVRHLLPVAEMGGLPNEYAHASGALLAWHAEDVGRGGRGIVGVLGPHRYDRDGASERVPVSSAHGFEMAMLTVWSGGWNLSVNGRYIASGPETGDSGKSAADTAALAHGMALLDADGLRLPVGGGE